MLIDSDSVIASGICDQTSNYRESVTKSGRPDSGSPNEDDALADGLAIASPELVKDFSLIERHQFLLGGTGKWGVRSGNRNFSSTHSIAWSTLHRSEAVRLPSLWAARASRCGALSAAKPLGIRPQEQMAILVPSSLSPFSTSVHPDLSSSLPLPPSLSLSHTHTHLHYFRSWGNRYTKCSCADATCVPDTFSSINSFQVGVHWPHSPALLFYPQSLRPSCPQSPSVYTTISDIYPCTGDICSRLSHPGGLASLPSLAAILCDRQVEMVNGEFKGNTSSILERTPQQPFDWRHASKTRRDGASVRPLDLSCCAGDLRVCRALVWGGGRGGDGCVGEKRLICPIA
ncbi:unnamed protein product [Protopolystoma xenopodis]|uniref:Uncharacterized protein n=1 Tax=Protopolystoma xenopodis TaxID=117903 RepID=A0A3S5AW21_9PLAT|nr:unnamed protein product [Protopolystoma xenopodis]